MKKKFDYEYIIPELNSKVNSEKKRFAEFHKCVFHIHTPASHDYTLVNRDIKNYLDLTDSEILELAYEIGFLLNNEYCIDDFKDENFENSKEHLCYLMIAFTLMKEEIELAVITDHNTISGYKKLCLSLKEVKEIRKFRVYTQLILGIEISCSDKNHVVGIFEGKNKALQENINNWLREFMMSDADGTYLTSIEVLGKINEFKGIGYIAHINSSNVFRESFFSGTYKKTLFNLPYFNLIGLSDMSKKDKIEELIRTYSNKKFNYIYDEDSHNLEDLGKKFFWIKGQKLNFQTIKNAIKDFEMTTTFKIENAPESYIKGIYIKNEGFLRGKNKDDNFILSFSEGMNCLIGGRGSGKSTVLNTLEFLISQTIEDKKTLENILIQGTSCIIYSYKKEDYYIMLNSNKDSNYKKFVENYYNTLENAIYALPNFDKERARTVAIRDRIQVYDSNLVRIKSPKNLLDTIFARKFSVNDLAYVASGEGINEFIMDMLSKNSVIAKKEKFGKTVGFRWIRNKYDKLDEILHKRKGDVENFIGNFNQQQNNKLRIAYQQKMLNDVDFPWVNIIQINPENKEFFIKKYSLKKAQLLNYLLDLSEIYDPIKISLLLVEKNYNELLQSINLLDYCENMNYKMIDEGIKELKKENLNNIFNEIRRLIMNSEELVITFLKEYLISFDNFKLEFNINNREMSETKGIIYKDVSELSMGQKVVAMLSFILSYGEYSNDFTPLLIDQPEDNLDNQYIYKNLVKDLRRCKSKRQVIVATHNSTIVTNTGSEQVIVMESNNISGWVECTGYATESNITKQIINKLEGGKESFAHKMFLYSDVVDKE